MKERRESLAKRDGHLAVEERQHLPVPPHARFSAFQALPRPGSGFVEIVPGKKGRTAPAQEMAASSVEHRGPARDGALKM